MIMSIIKTFEQEARRIFKKPVTKKLAIKLIRATDNKEIKEIVHDFINEGIVGEEDGSG